MLAATAAVLAQPLTAQAGFVAEYPAVQSTQAARAREWLMEGRQLDGMAAGLNSWIRMPRRVALRMVECPSSDIRWNQAERAVEICYRMATRLYGIAAEQDSLRRAASGAHLFMTFHGVAHAIIAELNLSVGADVEGAVDELTALMLATAHDGGFPLWILGGVSTIHDADPQWGSWAYATEHGLGPERFRKVACLVYGADAEGFSELRTAGLVPAGARQRCRAAALRSVDVWSPRLGARLR